MQQPQGTEPFQRVFRWFGAVLTQAQSQAKAKVRYPRNAKLVQRGIRGCMAVVAVQDQR